MYLVCHLTTHEHPIEGSWEFMGGSSLWYVIILLSLVIINIVIVEMKCF